ncbi:MULTISPECIES: response regulator [unclassified Nocardioides]|uniref:response regulator n=1 Tax=unclassified Nocardioides TaxID=2615069 RepID=UPI0000570DB1|nr:MULTISPECIES: response regulator [unclassified Nocardioides]ABL81487.1 PAS/PAC sensor hybrid histidine kinase [Nocardioides sp. JS614]
MELAGLYRDIVETSPDGFWVFDLDGRTLYGNPALRAFFGVGPEELLQLTVFDSLDEVGKEQFADHLDQLRAGKVNPHDVECRFVRRDGGTMWVTLSESLVPGPDGSVAVLHRLSDYSDRRRTVDDLTSSRRRLAEAQRIARIGSWEWDLAPDEIWGSEELCALYGLDPELFPASYADFLEIVHEDDRGAVDEAVRGALEAPSDFVFVARVRTADGAWVWTRGRGVSLADADGRVASMYGTHQDITETKLAEIALEDQVRQNVLLQAMATAANEAATLEDVLLQARHLVLLHDDWVRGRAFVPTEDRRAVVALHVTGEDQAADLAAPAQAAADLALANRAFLERGSVWDEDRLTIAFTVAHGDEVVAVLTITSAPPLHRFELIEAMVEQVGVQLGRVAERERAQRELADARDVAMAASRQKSEFLATMSHEIRTPLNGVIGLNDLLLRTPLDPDQLRLASGVQVASRALLGVINDILDFSKIEAGKLELERLDFEVRGVFDQVASLLGEAARAKGLELIVSCHSEVPEVLRGDPTRLAQVITNLGSNAVKFTEEGEVFIRATASPGPAGRTRLHVSVTDTGVGVPANDVGELFEAFIQADASTTRRFGGTGLGLAISREIVQALGGEIGMEPNPGGGSVFWFTADLESPGGPRVDADDEYARSWLSGRRVLVVDDNQHNRLILEEQLGWWRIRVAAASSADEAEQAVAAAHAAGDPFEAVLLDLSMPGRDGLDLARSLRAEPSYDLRVIMLASGSTPSAWDLRTAGIVACLTKPVLGAEVRAALLRHLAGVEPRPEPELPVVGPDPGPRARVLVVEDNEVNQLVAVGLLEALGYRARVAEDGAAALTALAEEHFDLVLMDVQMPRMDGYAATRAIRAGESDGRSRLPVVAMTAAAVEGERERCVAAGMDDFLTKPVDAGALAAVLDQWVGTRSGSVPRSVRVVSEEQNRGPDDALEGLTLDRLDELRDLDPDNTAYLDRAIGNFVANTPGTLESIRAAVAADDAATLKQVVHKLAGGALNLGVTRAGRTAQQIELIADTGTTDGAAELVEQLAEELADGRAALLAYQATYSAT